MIDWLRNAVMAPQQPWSYDAGKAFNICLHKIIIENLHKAKDADKIHKITKLI